MGCPILWNAWYDQMLLVFQFMVICHWPRAELGKFWLIWLIYSSTCRKDFISGKALVDTVQRTICLSFTCIMPQTGTGHPEAKTQHYNIYIYIHTWWWYYLSTNEYRTYEPTGSTSIRIHRLVDLLSIDKCASTMPSLFTQIAIGARRPATWRNSLSQQFILNHSCFDSTWRPTWRCHEYIYI